MLPTRDDLKLRAWVLAAVGAAVLAAGSLGMYAHDVQDRHVASARTALENCQQIELIKTQIRGTVTDSVRRLPTIAYYRHHPVELRRAVADAQRSVARFHPVDCYALPAVKGVVVPRKHG